MKNFFIYLTIGCLFLAAGCTKKAIIRKYYIIDIPADSSVSFVERTAPLPFHLEIRDFEVAKAFSQMPIALRTQSNELNYYFYHHWAVKPGTGIADIIFACIDQSGLFQKVTRGYIPDSDYCLMGHVYAIERLQNRKKASAHLHLKFVLLDHHLTKPLLFHEFDRTKPFTPQKQMNPFAVAVSEILFEEFELFIEDILNYFDESGASLED